MSDSRRWDEAERRAPHTCASTAVSVKSTSIRHRGRLLLLLLLLLMVVVVVVVAAPPTTVCTPVCTSGASACFCIGRHRRRRDLGHTRPLFRHFTAVSFQVQHDRTSDTDTVTSCLRLQSRWRRLPARKGHSKAWRNVVSQKEKSANWLSSRMRRVFYFCVTRTRTQLECSSS